MTRELIIKELQTRGYDVKEEEAVKNGVRKKGIMFRVENGICPIVYTDEIICEAEAKGWSVEEVADQIITLSSKSPLSFEDIAHLKERDFILSHIFVGLRKQSEPGFVEEALKKRCGSELEGLESYLYLRFQSAQAENMSIQKFSLGFLEMAGVSLDEAWEQAYENAFAETALMPLNEVLDSFFKEGFLKEGCSGEDCEMYILTNQEKIYGASAILDREKLSLFAKGMGVSRFIVIPSSIHEMLLVPCHECINMDELNEFVRQINETLVIPEERLADRVYMMEF